MVCLSQGLLLLIISAAASSSFLVDGCLEGYKLISPYSEYCVMVTPPGTWLEAFSMCILPEGESSNPTSFVLHDTNGIHAYLRRQMVSEVWLWPSDYTSLNNQVAQNSISWLDELFYSFHLSRWKWSTSSENECITYSLTTLNQSESSCSPEDPKQKLPFVCILPQGAYETPTQSFGNACVDGAFRGFEFEERDVCYLMDDRVTERLAGKDYPSAGLNGRNYTHCEWLGGINQTELHSRVDNECQSQTTVGYYTGKPAMMEQTTKGASFSIYDTVYKALKGVHMLKNITIHHLHKRDVVPRESSLQCLLCAPSAVEEGVQSPSIQLQKDGRANEQLTLILLNFDSNEIEVVTCFTDASLTNFTVPNYKMIKITISPINKQTLTRELTFRKTAIEDSFFLRLRRSNAYQHTSLLDNDIEMELTEYFEGHYHSAKFLKIPFNVSEEGNYWCVGQDYITKRPIFTKRILVEKSIEEKWQLYLVRVEVPRKYDPILYCRKFGTIMARNLNIMDANIELKRITSNKDSHLLLYHVTLLQNYTSSVGAVPKEFKFYVENTNQGLANITSVHKLSSHCPTTTLNSFEQLLVNLTSTLKGHPPRVIPVAINGYIVNVVYICVGDAVEGAVWKEIVPGDPYWKKVWNPSRQFGSFTLLNITTELNTIRKNPIESDKLPEVTDLIKVLLNRGEGSATSNGQALEDLEYILSELKFDPKGSGVVTDKRDSELAILVSDLSRKNPVVGISLTSKNGQDTIVGISSTDSDRSRGMPADNSEVVVRLPQNIASRFQRVAFAVFSNVQTFNSNTSNIRVNSRIVDIVLSNPGKIPDHSKLPNGEVIEIYFKPTSKVLDSESAACAFWDMQNAVWSTQGCVLDRAINLCRCNHLTHFAQIITGSGARLSPGHQKALEIISITGCTLSLLGLLVIVATGIVFKAWRQEVGNQVLLNLTAALTLNLVTYLLVHSGVGGNKGGGCIFIGVVLHYSVLACFCWMLVMSGLQLVRLLTMLGNRNTSKLLLKSGLFAWGVPFIPIAILLIIGPTTYASSTDNSMERGFCYPTGVAFYTTVITPVVFIIMVNLVAYIAILCRLFSCCGWGELNTGIQRHGLSDGIIAMRRIRILVFLFFLFGLTWTFAFLAKYIFFAYLFCITATLQGFVIFVFFFVIEHKSRGYWKVEFFQTPGKRNYKSSDTLSSVTYSTATHKTSESKSSWYIENVPLQNKDNGTYVRTRNKEKFAASPSQEEEPLKLRFSQQNITTPEAFSETYKELEPLKGDSFEVDESVTLQIQTFDHSILLDTGDLGNKITETVSESPKLQPSIEVKLTSLSSNKDDAIVQDSGSEEFATNSVPSKRASFEDDERLEQKTIIPQIQTLKDSTLQDTLDFKEDSMEKANESPKVLHSPVEVKLSNWSGNKEDTLFSNIFVKDSESGTSSSGASTESSTASIKIVQDNNDGLAVNNDNITIVCGESNRIEKKTLESEILPTSQLSPKYKAPMPKEQSAHIPPAASTSTVACSNNKAVEQTNPTKRSPFIVTCPITRH